MAKVMSGQMLQTAWDRWERGDTWKAIAKTYQYKDEKGFQRKVKAYIKTKEQEKIEMSMEEIKPSTDEIKEIADDLKGINKEEIEYFEKLQANPTPKMDGSPWKTDFLSLQEGHEGFSHRWVLKKNVQSRLNAGYQIAKKDDYKGVAQNFVGSPSQSGSLVIRDDLILMEIKKDLKEKFEQERINRTEAMTESKKLDRAIPQDIIIS
jgi:hypothetical protein